MKLGLQWYLCPGLLRSGFKLKDSLGSGIIMAVMKKLINRVRSTEKQLGKENNCNLQNIYLK